MKGYHLAAFALIIILWIVSIVVSVANPDAYCDLWLKFSRVHEVPARCLIDAIGGARIIN